MEACQTNMTKGVNICFPNRHKGVHVISCIFHLCDTSICNNTSKYETVAGFLEARYNWWLVRGGTCLLAPPPPPPPSWVRHCRSMSYISYSDFSVHIIDQFRTHSEQKKCIVCLTTSLPPILHLKSSFYIFAFQLT